MNQKPVKCIITAMGVEFLAITECFHIERSLHYQLDDKYVIAECQERNIVIAQSGVGKENAETCAKAIYTRFPQVAGFISAGLAGALSAQLNTGDIVIGDAIIENTQEEWKRIHITDQIVQSMINQNIQRGSILCSDEFIKNAEEKQRLNVETGAVCVEMESSGIAGFAHANEVPFAAIKVISDHADEKALRSMIRIYNMACNKLASYLNDIVGTAFCSC